MSKISAYTALTLPASSDVLPVVDVSDTSMAASGTTKKIAVSDLASAAAGNICNAAYAGGADPTGASDSTLAFNAAVAALPTVTLHDTGAGGATLAVPQGTILIPAGTFKFGSLGTDTSNIGPCVNLIGAGRNATTIMYYGAGDAIRMYCPLVSSDRAFDYLPALAGRINGFTVDGTNASAGAAGLHYGDTEGGVLGPDLMITNFSQGTLASPTSLGATAVAGGGTFAANTYWWAVTALTRTGETMVSTSATATIALNGHCNLAWTGVSGATGYRVYRNTSNAFTNLSYNLVTTLGAVTSYTDTGTAGYQTTGPPVNCSGNIGLWFDNSRAWTESIYGRVILRNCATAVMFSIVADAGVDVGPSFEYNDFTFKIYAFPNQNGVVMREGAWFQHGSLKIRGNFATSNAVQQSAVLAHTGCVPAGNIKALNPTVIVNSRLDIQAETNTLTGTGGTNYPSTILWGDVNTNVITGCTGILSFSTSPFWSPSNYNASGSTTKYGFQFHGVILGDVNLNPANDSHIVCTGGLTLSQGKFPSTTTFRASSGDVFSTVLTGSVTVVFDPFYLVAAPARKTVFIQQAAAGGPFTVTWPKPGSPTLSAPAVYWPGGTAPTISTAANAIDKIVLETVDGIRWYGTFWQAFS